MRLTGVKCGRLARRALVGLALICATGSCSRDVLVAGAGGLSDGGGTAPATSGGSATGGGTAPDGGTVQTSPACNGNLFAKDGLPGIQLADQAADSVTGDWNDDGHLDLAIADATLSAVTVVLGHGDGTFASPVQYPMGGSGGKIAAGDLNGDGHLDLVLATPSTNAVGVLLGKGDGTFGRRSDWSTGPNIPAVVVGDFTGDSKPDVVAGDTLLAGRGDGTFAPGVTYGYTPSALAAGDLNGDGRLDLVVSQSDSVFVLLNQGAGSFASKRYEPASPSATILKLRDLNGDGKLDLALSGPCPTEGTQYFETFLGTGDGFFVALAEYDTQLYDSQFRDMESVCGLPFEFADLNGDGNIDALFGTYETWLGQGNGGFAPALLSSLAQADVHVRLRDWDRDGKLDLAVVDSSAVLRVLPGRGDGTFGVEPLYPVDEVASALIDLSGDGQPDLLGYGGSSPFGPTVTMRRGRGDGTFFTQVEYPLGASTPILATGDINGDGVPDLVNAGSGLPSVSYTVSDGVGVFVPGPELPLQSWPTAAVFGDVDGDGHADLLVADESFVFTTFRGRGDGWLEAQPVVSNVTLEWPESVAFGDLDGDGRLDAAVLTNNVPPFVKLLFGTPSGALVENGGFDAGNSYGSLQMADLNQDGKPDLFTAANVNQVVRVWLGLGAGLFGPPADFPLPSGPYPPPPLVFAPPTDVNGDGTLDLVVGRERLMALLGWGDGTFACADSVADFSPVALFVTDLNHDRKPDVVASLRRSMTVVLSR